MAQARRRLQSILALFTGGLLVAASGCDADEYEALSQPPRQGAPTARSGGSDQLPGTPDGGISALDSAIVAPDSGFPRDTGVAPFDGIIECQNRCDCPQGWECLFNVCRLLQVPVYCCDKPGCPQGQLCVDTREIPGQCGLPGPPVGGVS